MTVFGRTALTLAFVATPLSACVDPEVAALCRAHSDDVLVFRWSGGRDVLPVDAGMTDEQDRAWRQRLNLPARSNHGLEYVSRRISAVEPFADGWLVGMDSGEWSGGLHNVREGEPARQLEHGNVHALIADDGGVRAFFGLAHLGAEYGEHRLITLAEDGLRVGEAEPLPGAPVDIARYNGMLFAAGVPERRGGSPAWGRVFRSGHGLETARVSRACR